MKLKTGQDYTTSIFVHITLMTVASKMIIGNKTSKHCKFRILILSIWYILNQFYKLIYVFCYLFLLTT